MAALLDLKDLILPTPKPVRHIAGEKEPLVQFAGPERTMEAVRKLNGCDAAGKPAGKFYTEYTSKSGPPLVTFIHPGGHEIPDEAPKRIVEFFKTIHSTKKAWWSVRFTVNARELRRKLVRGKAFLLLLPRCGGEGVRSPGIAACALIHGHWVYGRPPAIASSPCRTSASSAGRTLRASSFPSFRNTRVGHSFTWNDRPSGFPFPSPTFTCRTAGKSTSAAAMAGCAP